MRGHREEKGPLKGVRGVQARPAAAHRELSIAGVPTQLHTLFFLNMNINEGLLKYNHSSPRMQQPPGQSVSPHRLHARVLVLPQTCLVLSAKNQLAAHCPPLGSPTNLCLCCACVSVCACVFVPLCLHLKACSHWCIVCCLCHLGVSLLACQSAHVQ